MHDHHGRAALGHHVRHRRVLLQSPDVVDDADPEGDRAARDLGLGGVDRKWRVDLGQERREHRLQAPPFLVERNGGVTGPGRFRPDVDDVGAVGGEFAGLGQRKVERLKAPAVGKRIRRHVENAHDDRLHPDQPEKGVAALIEPGPNRRAVHFAPQGPCRSFVVIFDIGEPLVADRRSLERPALFRGTP